MGWVPSKTSIGGLYSNRKFLNVSMTNWLDYAGMSYSGEWCVGRNNGTAGRASLSGTIGDAYIDYKTNHTSTTNDLLCEFEIKTPHVNNIRKQSIAFYFESYWNYRDYRGQQFYEIADITFTFTKKTYYDDGSIAESTIGSQRTAGVTIGRYIINYMTAWNMGFSNPNNLIFNTGTFVANGNTYYGIGLVINGDNVGEAHTVRLVGILTSRLATIFNVETFEEVAINDPNYDQNDKDLDWFGGDGTHDDHSDDIDEPDILDVGAASSGMLTLYAASESLMQQFSQALWDENLIAEIKKFVAKPLDWIISVKMVPFVPPAVNGAYPKWGNVQWPVPLNIIENQYYELDCGSLYIDRYWGNCFDYDPYTRIEIWLPYVGYRDLPVDLIMGHNLHCRYEIDCLTGCCCVILSVDAISSDSEHYVPGSDASKVIGQYYGNCAVQIPITSESNDGLVQTMMAAAGSFLNKAIPAFAQQALQPPEEYSDFEATMNVSAGALSSAGTTVRNITAMKSVPTRSGVAGMANGMMSVQTPFVHIKRPNQSRPDNFRDLHGYMSNMPGPLSEFTGYAEVEDIQLNNIPAFEPELKEIIQLLKGGVII